MKPQAILIGLIAGAAAALLFAGLILQSPTAVVLSLATPIPIFIASLGWGSAAGLLAALASGVAISALTGTASGALILVATMTLPAAVIGHLAGLAKPSERSSEPGIAPATDAPALDWFPLPRILFSIAGIATAACLFVGWLVGYDTAEIGTSIGEALSAQLAANGADPATQAEIQTLAALMVRIVPFVQPALLTIILVACLHLSGLIARASGRLPRPRDDIPASAGLPKIAIAVFGLAILGTFLSGPPASVAAVFAGTFGAAFTMVGLASFHRRMRGRPARGLILFAAYTAIVFLSFPLLAATILGLTETMRRPAGPAASA